MKALFGIIAALTTSVVFVSPARAGELTTGELISFCLAKDDLPLAACLFFILGATEGAGLSANMTDPHQKRICIPDGVSSEEMKLIFLRMAQPDVKAYPDDANLPAVSLVTAVMLTNFPCSAAGSGNQQ